MTISIWIILSIFVAAGFWVYYKKNKHKIESPKSSVTNIKKKYVLSDLDQMLENISADTNERIDNKIDDSDTDISAIKEKKPEESQKDHIDIKKSIQDSIIFEKRKKK